MEPLARSDDFRRISEGDYDDEMVLRGLEVLRDRLMDKPEVLQAIEDLRHQLQPREDEAKRAPELEEKQRRFEEQQRFRKYQEQRVAREKEEQERRLTPEEHYAFFRKVFDRVAQNFFVRTTKSMYDFYKMFPILGRFLQFFEDRAVKLSDVAPNLYEEYCYDMVEELYEIYRKDPTTWPREVARILSPRNVLLWAMRQNTQILGQRLEKLRSTGSEVFNEAITERLDFATKVVQSVNNTIADNKSLSKVKDDVAEFADFAKRATVATVTDMTSDQRAR